MPDILHKVGIKSPTPDATYAALTTRDGLAAWWTRDTEIAGDDAGVIRFRFGTGGFDMKVLERERAKRVLWQVVGGPEAWVGTRIGFELRQDGDQTTVLFKHEGWWQADEFMHHCSTKWAVFLLSLKSLVETGAGAPWPNDVQVAA